MIIDFVKLVGLQSEAITFVIGSFDLLHTGHLHFLQKAKEVGGGKLLVGIIEDDIITEQKGKDRPIVSQQDRAELVDALKVVDYVFLAPALSISEVANEVIRSVHPENAVASREDYETRKQDWQTKGTNLILIDKIPERSTTKIVQKITRLRYTATDGQER